MRLREARASDHPTFVRLFAELGVDDPVLDSARFAAEVAPTMLVAEEGSAALGYVYFQLASELAYVRQLVTAPEARRRGVAQALLAAVAERARAAGASSWCLNVKRENAAAIALYERVGMATAYASSALELARVVLDRLPRAPAGLVVRVAGEDEDARAADAAKTTVALVAVARARGRTPFLLEEDGVAVGGAIFDARFPGAFPFRVERGELAPPFVRALADLVPDAPILYVTAEAQPAATNALVAHGAVVRFEILHMTGELA